MKTTRRTFIQTIGAVLAGIGLGVKATAECQHDSINGEPCIYCGKTGLTEKCDFSKDKPWKARYNQETNTIEINNSLDARIANVQERMYTRMLNERLNPPAILHENGRISIMDNSYLDPHIRKMGEKLGKLDG